MADEDAAAIPVEGHGNAEATEQVVQEAEVAFSGFGEEELAARILPVASSCMPRAVR